MRKLIVLRTLTLVGLAFSLVMLLLALSTPYWLETDGLLPNPRFLRLGLWEVCFENFRDPLHLYDRYFKGCRWIFDEEYHVISDIILPPFFVAVQWFFTFSFVFHLVACIVLVMLQTCCTPQKERVTLRSLAGILFFAAFCGTISLITFGAEGDSQYWMPDWKHNHLSWSFACGFLGVFVQYVVAILCLVEARQQIKKAKRHPQIVYSVEGGGKM